MQAIADLNGEQMEVLPVIRVDDQTISAGKPGRVARRLQDAYRQAVADYVRENTAKG